MTAQWLWPNNLNHLNTLSNPVQDMMDPLQFAYEAKRSGGEIPHWDKLCKDARDQYLEKLVAINDI